MHSYTMYCHIMHRHTITIKTCEKPPRRLSGSMNDRKNLICPSSDVTQESFPEQRRTLRVQNRIEMPPGLSLAK